MSSPLPIVLCALDAGIGKPASELLLPEFEVIHFIQSLSAAQSEIPHLLAGRDPQSPHVNNVGTKDYSRPARAIIFGRGFDLEDIEALRENVAGISQDPVLWIAGDPSRKPPPGAVLPPNIHQLVAGIARKLLGGWVEAGAASNEVILY
ncbi:hypothetical protein E8E15_011028 [Penicillium rubens]|uniref:Pc12g09370 protein n=2 Tax=Penicillium chrysogenum species complex TaxID=254878 RepID=B6GZ97_PENRW|nr:uncharacterized protein N7525_001630 [Penicillium rubens]KZN85144.1 hypothetical protein EN45_093160 [Penicillium chrysogenum]CAP80564.1 Pc12g09370 [Penicillium rubens Wisconsin 54-1255]KAF3029111.1 hypothetical protein E8E15_011028 [Penicillium rubens]KAJ5034404.1 hypothetical protein NUH16_005841 [Penicillium rubens]KAJ5843889.1 hypothetical protein N7525_001630 [Penicillium rubens]